MSRTRPHAKPIVIPQKLLDEEARLKKKGLKIKQSLVNLDGPNKLSHAITTLLSSYDDKGGNLKAYSMLVAIACAAWNASLIEEPERGQMVNEVVNLFKNKTDAKGLDEFRQFSYELIERKLLLFPNDRRFIVKYDVTETKDNYHVFVISLDKAK